MDDILDLLDKDEKPFKETQNNNNGGYNKNYNNNYNNDKPKQKNLWDDTTIKPLAVDTDKFIKTGVKKFTVCVFKQNGVLSDADSEKIVEIAKVLSNKGYVFRHTGNADDKLQNAILDVEDIKVEHYLPWPKFNSDVTKAVLKKPTEDGYRIAVNSHKVYFKLPPAVRAILARNVHSLLGKDCNDPSTLLIVYTDCGSEAITKGMDYKKTGDVTFFLKVAEDSNIPVFNMKNDDAIKRLAEYLKQISDK